jgi:hypothetical protein
VLHKKRFTKNGDPLLILLTKLAMHTAMLVRKIIQSGLYIAKILSFAIKAKSKQQ